MALETILSRVGHALFPLLALNTIFDIISLAVTRHILRKASNTTNMKDYVGLIGLDFTIAVALVLLSAISFANFYFAPDTVTGILLFFAYLAFVPAVTFLILGPVAIRWELKGELQTHRSSQNLGAGTPGSHAGSSVSKAEGIVLAIILLVISLVVIALAISNSFYVPYYQLDWSDISLVLIMSVSLTAIIPSILNLLVLLVLLSLRMIAWPAHTVLAHFLLRVAETNRGAIYVVVAILAALKDVLTMFAK